jgi:natural product biosynthesis luciferase-like monooxygenase protein
MKLGMLHLFENPAGKTEHEVIKEQMELMYEAETLGFDSVWPAEHHFTEYGYCASPQVSLAAVAARTKRIRLGTGVVVLPFHNPVRVAEDFAFLDLMSDGRVDLGVGRGYQPGEYAGFGLADKQSESRAMFDEAVSLVRKCWTEERVTFKGKYYQVEDLMVRPKPLQQPHPPIYMACLSAESFRLAGHYGFHVLMSGAFGLSPDGAKAGIADYRAGRREAGLDPATGKIALLLKVYAGDTMDGARHDYAGPCTWYYRTIAKYVAPPAGQGPIKSYELYTQTRGDAEFRRSGEQPADGVRRCRSLHGKTVGSDRGLRLQRVAVLDPDRWPGVAESTAFDGVDERVGDAAGAAGDGTVGSLTRKQIGMAQTRRPCRSWVQRCSPGR